MNSEIKAGDIVVHVHKDFANIKLYVVKQYEDGRFKCRYKQGDLFISDDFEAFEIIPHVPRKGPGVRILS